MFKSLVSYASSVLVFMLFSSVVGLLARRVPARIPGDLGHFVGEERRHTARLIPSHQLEFDERPVEALAAHGTRDAV